MTVGGTRLVLETRAWRLLHASGACLRACLVLASLNASAPERGIVCKRHAAMPLCRYAAMPLRVCARQAQRRRHRQAFCWPNIT